MSTSGDRLTKAPLSDFAWMGANIIVRIWDKETVHKLLSCRLDWTQKLENSAIQARFGINLLEICIFQSIPFEASTSANSHIYDVHFCFVNPFHLHEILNIHICKFILAASRCVFLFMKHDKMSCYIAMHEKIVENLPCDAWIQIHGWLVVPCANSCFYL